MERKRREKKREGRAAKICRAAVLLGRKELSESFVFGLGRKGVSRATCHRQEVMVKAKIVPEILCTMN